jgi:uncharacterized membrane protein YeaQ/YmgE (transglycosylase-associated protein family)
MVLAAVVSTVGFVGWLIIGGLAGALAGRVMRGKGFGCLGDIVVGVVGALVLGLISGLFLNATLGLISSFILAFVGAALLLWLVRLITANRTSP